MTSATRVRIGISSAAVGVLAGLVFLASILRAQPRALAGTLPAQKSANEAHIPPHFNVPAQTACESEMLEEMGAHEVFSGKPYEMLTEVARAYGRAIPRIYISPGSLNMFYIAGSTSVDGRGKIVVGQQAVKLFDASSLKGFMGHEMAHLVTDSAAQGCNDYILRDPRMEVEADALAARTLGSAPVKAFLQRVLVLTKGENWEAKHRFEVLSDVNTRDARVTLQDSSSRGVL